MAKLYFVALCVAWVLCALPILLVSLCVKKHKNSLKARFFLYKNPPPKPVDVHFHACSLGEVKSIENLAANFNSRISVITQTGFDEAKKHFESVNFLAFETFLPFWLTPCKVLVIFEAELWLMLVLVAKKRGAKVILLNARISEKSFPKYRKFAFLYKKIFANIDEIYAQSEADKKRLENLGAKSVSVLGNIKANAQINASKAYTKPNARLIVFASTHENEENLLLANFTLKKGEKLIIAPRHPERFEKVYEIAQIYAQKHALKCVKFSDLNLKDLDLRREFKGDILILNALGELVNFYAICDVVALCGSFIDGIGGHNPIEIAHFQKPIISGKFIHNQKALYANVENIAFCEDITKLSTLVSTAHKPTQIKNAVNLERVVKSIKSGICENSRENA